MREWVEAGLMSKVFLTSSKLHSSYSSDALLVRCVIRHCVGAQALIAACWGLV